MVYRDPAADATSTAEKFRQLREHLVTQFPERQHVIDGALCAVLASEHVFMLGPPGTGKSSLLRAVAGAFSGRYFERLLTKYSTPDEVFGPQSLRALEEDRFERVTVGKLPEAEFAFVDEVFNANSAILNSMLTVMNERLYHNGTQVIQCPLVTMVGASNALPEGRDLDAVFDRFLLRFDVQYLAQLANLRAVLSSPDPRPQTWVSMDELRQAQDDAAAVAVPDEVLDGLIGVREVLQGEGIVLSDRRWKKCLALVRASAYLAGESRASAEDLLVVVDALWREPRERSKVARVVGGKADPVGAEAQQVLESAREVAKNVSSLRAGDKDKYVGAAVKAIELYVEQKNKLAELSRSAGKRSRAMIADAQREVQGLHAETQRVVSASLGLPSGLRAS